MPPADSSQDEGGLYQPPRPPLPAPVPYTHPTPSLPPMLVRPQIFPAGGFTRHGVPPHSIPPPNPMATPNHNISLVAIALPGMTTGPPPPYHTTQQINQGCLRTSGQTPGTPRTAVPQQANARISTPLAIARYQPFQQTPEYQPPPNPRVGAAGLPPATSNKEEEPARPLTFLPPLGGPGSLSCPTSLSLQGVQNLQPRTSASGLASGTTVPGPGCWSLPRDTAGGIPQDSDAEGEHNHSRGDSAPVSLPLTTEELKTRSLPTRCMHGARPPTMSRRNLVLSDNDGGGRGATSIMTEEECYLYNEPLTEELEEDLYGSSEDLSSGPSILEKLMVWAYYNTDEQELENEQDFNRIR